MLNSFAEESHECVDECLVVRGAKTCRRCATNGKQLDFGNPRHGPRACHILVADTMIGVVISRFALADASRFVKGELPADSYLSDSVEIMAGPRADDELPPPEEIVQRRRDGQNRRNDESGDQPRRIPLRPSLPSCSRSQPRPRELMQRFLSVKKHFFLS